VGGAATIKKTNKQHGTSISGTTGDEPSAVDGCMGHNHTSFTALVTASYEIHHDGGHHFEFSLKCYISGLVQRIKSTFM